MENPSAWINLAQIDDDPGPFCMSFAFDLEVLVGSIKKIGLVNPPHVTRKTRGQGFEVVSGYRRILALKTLGCEKVLCKDLSQTASSPLECLLFNLYDNLSTRAFNEVEKAMILQRLNPLVSRREILQEYMPLLGLPSHEPVVEVYLRVPDLALQIKEAFARGLVSFQTVKALMNMDSTSQNQVLKFISELRFTFNQQRQFLDMITDLALRNRASVSDFFAKSKLLGFLEPPIENRPQRAKQVLKALRQLRYPRLTRSERVFRKKVASLKLPEGVSLKPAPYFEGSEYCLEIRFRNGKSLKQKIEALSNIRELASMGDLWLKGE